MSFPGSGLKGVMEKKLEATIVCWGYIGIMEQRMEAAKGFGVLGFEGLGLRVWRK